MCDWHGYIHTNPFNTPILVKHYVEANQQQEGWGLGTQRLRKPDCDNDERHQNWQALCLSDI